MFACERCIEAYVVLSGSSWTYVTLSSQDYLTLFSTTNTSARVPVGTRLPTGCSVTMLPYASQLHHFCVLELQVTATLSAAALKAANSGKDKQGDKADVVLASLKRVLDINGRDDFSVSALQLLQ